MQRTDVGDLAQNGAFNTITLDLDIILIYFLAFLPCVRHSLSCRSQRTNRHATDIPYNCSISKVYVIMYIACISVSKPTPWAVAGPHGQLASNEYFLQFHWSICFANESVLSSTQEVLTLLTRTFLFLGLPTWFLYQNIENVVPNRSAKIDGGCLRIGSYPYTQGK